MEISNVNQLVVSTNFKSHSLKTSTSAQTREASTNSSLDDNRQSALKTLERLVTDAYKKLSIGGRDAIEPTSTGKSAIAAYNSNEPLTAKKASNNILGFIERRLLLDVQEGATLTQLQSRLEAGLSGFQKGFAQAQEQLSALSMLTPEIGLDIQSTYDQVLKGIDDLRLRFLETASNVIKTP